MLQGKEHVEVPRAVPGDICAVAKVDELHFDAVLHDAAEDDHIHLKPLDFPVPVHGLAIEPKRRGDEQRMWEILQQAGRRGPVPEGRARRRHQRDRDLRPGRAAPAHAARAADRGLQVRGRHAAAAHRLPRDHHRAGRRPPPPQEADRRRRPVRRGVPAHRAAAARRGLRVRRPGQGRHDPRPVHPGGREGRAPGAGQPA